MDDYKILIQTLLKEIVTVKEYREITNNELVSEVKELKKDEKKRQRFEIKLQNGENYYITVKKTFIWF